MESSLSLKYTDIAGEVGLFLGYGRGSDHGDTAWTSQQRAAIDSCVRSGLRQFYFPPPLDQGGVSYDWSFLKPTTTLTLPSGQDWVDLPDDFGGIEGRLNLTSGTGFYPVQIVGEGSIRQRHAERDGATGRPEYAAVRPKKGTDKQKGQRFQLYFFPGADDDHEVSLTYYILADCLSGDRPYAYGGMMHAETILESCLAIAEQRLDDAASVHSMKFQERLAASISQDRKFKPQLLGYNGDHSDGWTRNRRFWTDPLITFDGVDPS